MGTTEVIFILEVVGTIAGDDTIMCAARSTEDAISVIDKLRKFVEE